MQAYRVNIDYEYFLFDPHYQASTAKYQKMIEEWEYIYWYCDNSGTLLTQKNYPTIELKKIEKIINAEVKLTKQTDKVINWFGDTTNKELMQKCNSRVYSTQWALNENLLDTNQTKILPTLPEELPAGYLMKEEGGFSGMGIHQSLKKCRPPVIVEPYYERTGDFSVLFIEGKPHFYQNKIDNKFQYKGSVVKNAQAWELRDLDLSDEHKSIASEVSQKIFKHYHQMSPQAVWGYDFFTYEQNGKSKIYPVNEVNFRKTLGYFFIKLCTHLGKSAEGAQLVFETAHIPKNFSGEIVSVSPKANKFQLSLLLT
ncbi:MAG: hypothetical protein JNM93_12580 [Bacteriovoracaceae bacterium]|nr:hypothetical protein [Bacteriovoracaceae bacterium]